MAGVRGFPVRTTGPKRAIDGSCPSCGHDTGILSEYTKVVECHGCDLPWPESYWNEDR